MANFNLESIFSEQKKKLTLISLGLLGAGLLADFLTNVVWFSRINPWFRYGEYSLPNVYNATCVCWFFSLVGLIAVVALVICFLYVKKIFNMVSENSATSIIVIVTITILSLISLLAALVSAHYGLKEEYGYMDYRDPVNYKCYKDFFEMDDELNSLRAYISLKNKYISYDKWENKIYRKIFKETTYKDYDGEDHDTVKLTGYLCADVGAPSLVFALVQIFGLCLFYFVVITSICSEETNKSINEDDNPINIEEQPKKIESNNEQPRENENNKDEKIVENEQSD